MKRFLLPSFAAVLLGLLIPAESYAVCQYCENAQTLNAMCRTIGACDVGATMGACVVVEETNDDGEVVSRNCDSVGSTPGPECNGADPGCGNGGGGGGGTGGGGGDCVVSWSAPCPAQCSSCIRLDDNWCPWCY